MTPIATAIVECKTEMARQLLNFNDQKVDLESLNRIYNQDDTVLSLSIKHCPELFLEIANLKVEKQGELFDAIEDYTLTQLTTDANISHQSLLMLATKRGLFDIVEFLCQLDESLTNVN